VFRLKECSNVREIRIMCFVWENRK